MFISMFSLLILYMDIILGKLRVGPTGQVELKLTMKDMWKEPFGLSYLAFGNLVVSVGIQPGVPVPMLGGSVFFTFCLRSFGLCIDSLEQLIWYSPICWSA